MTTKALEVASEAIDLPRRKESTMDLLTLALQNNAAIDVIERLAALQEKALLRDAEVQFNEALTAAQSEIGRIAPDSHNNQTNSDWASYAAMDKVIRPVYIKNGFSLSFDAGDAPAETVVAVCYLSHRGGHTRKYKSPPVPSDGKGAKGGDVMTKTHATGAAMSYAMRYLLKYIFNVAIGADDTDGNLQWADLEERLEWIANCSTLAELEKIFKTAYKDALAAKASQQTLKALIAAKDKRRGDLR